MADRSSFPGVKSSPTPHRSETVKPSSARKDLIFPNGRPTCSSISNSSVPLLRFLPPNNKVVREMAGKTAS